MANKCDWCGRRIFSGDSYIENNEGYEFCSRKCAEEWDDRYHVPLPTIVCDYCSDVISGEYKQSSSYPGLKFCSFNCLLEYERIQFIKQHSKPTITYDTKPKKNQEQAVRTSTTKPAVSTTAPTSTAKPAVSTTAPTSTVKPAVSTTAPTSTAKPTTDPFAYNKGLQFYIKGEYDKAFNEFDSCIAAKMKNELVYFYRGNCYLKKTLRESDKAMIDFAESIKINPKYYAPYAYRGLEYFRLNQFDLALDDANNAVRFSQSNFLGYMVRGMAYIKKGKKTEALKNLEKALSLKPGGLDVPKDFKDLHGTVNSKISEARGMK